MIMERGNNYPKGGWVLEVEDNWDILKDALRAPLLTQVSEWEGKQ